MEHMSPLLELYLPHYQMEKIIESTGISLFGLPVMSVGSSDCLLLSLSLFSISNFSCSSS